MRTILDPAKLNRSTCTHTHTHTHTHIYSYIHIFIHTSIHTYIHHTRRFVDRSQFGFIPSSSTAYALITMFHQWLKTTDGTDTDVRTVLVDYKKAFDLGDHNLLISKLYSLGVKTTVVNWVIDFLIDRSQKVKLNTSCFSSWTKIRAGIPQGTRLGPWLFLVMINDLMIQQKMLFWGNLQVTVHYQK